MAKTVYTAAGSSKESYLYDGRGSVVQTAAVSGKLSNFYYDPYGEVDEKRSDIDQNKSFYGYNGEDYSPVTKLQYLRARYYAPKMGSFITEDSHLGDLSRLNSQNRYAYAEGDPVGNIDPSGHAALGIAAVIFGFFCPCRPCFFACLDTSSYRHRHERNCNLNISPAEIP